jgi:ABC-type maltose transport system permease subunit
MIVVMLILTLSLVVFSSLFLSWRLLKQGRKKLMYAMIIVTLIASFNYIIKLIDLYNIFTSLGV